MSSTGENLDARFDLRLVRFRAKTLSIVLTSALTCCATFAGDLFSPCQESCSNCSASKAGSANGIVISMTGVESIGSRTRFSYSVCREPEGPDLTHWVLGLSPECCSRLIGSGGGSLPLTQCAFDSATGLYGLRFATAGGIAVCGADRCAEGGTVFNIQVAGDMGVGCLQTASRADGGIVDHAGCIQGPSCPPCQSNAECNDTRECTDDSCNEDGTCLFARLPLGTICESDQNLCTTDNCDGLGHCVFVDQLVCTDNGLSCDGPEKCDPGTGVCVSGPPPCEPGSDRCCDNRDICVPAGGCCSDSECDTSTPCISTETCDTQGVCVVATELTDCNTNGVDDACDIAEGSSQDCDGSFVPDECETDCNGNGFHDSCDLATGTSADCNANGIPDACDIADCGGVPACDDCNLNGVPDGCDIDAGNSLDVEPQDGIPDDCVDPDSTNGDWTDDIWNLQSQDPENPYPDNQDGVSNLHVTIDGFTVFLDDTVEIQTLRLLNGGTLLVTQCEVGDFTAVAGDVLNEGNLLVGGDRHIDVAEGSITIGPGGRYAATTTTCGTVCPAGAGCASLSARDLLLIAGDCTSFRSGADVVIDESMSVTLSGDLLLLGNPFFGCDFGRAVAPRGIDVPPKFRVSGSVMLRNVQLDGATSSSLSTALSTASRDGGGAAAGVSPVGIHMSGDFVNHSIAPSLFDWVTGYLAAIGTEQVFEVGGIDLGPGEEGFLTTRPTLFDTGPHSNFAIGTLEVFPGSHLTFVNDFASTVGDGPCEEAFYVKRLILHEGATLTLDDVNVYYESLETGGTGPPGAGVIETLGCGSLRGLCAAQTPGTDSVAKNRFISVTTGIPGRQQAIRVILEDLPAPYDTLNGQVMWVGEPTAVNESAPTATPEPGKASFWASQLQCTPYYADWSVWGTVQVYHEAVVPGGIYPVQTVDQSCIAGFEADFSVPLDLHMARFGDLVGTCSPGFCTPPNGVVDILDLFAVINAFASVPGTINKIRADLDPAVPDFVINITDALVVVDAFVGLSYPFAPPQNPCGSP